MFSLGFHSENSKIPCGFPRKETSYAPVSGIPLHGNQGETWGFLHWNQVETTWKNPGIQGETLGNHKEFRVSHMETRGIYMETQGFQRET